MPTCNRVGIFLPVPISITSTWSMSNLSSHHTNDDDNLGHTGHDHGEAYRRAWLGCPSSPLRAT